MDDMVKVTGYEPGIPRRVHQMAFDAYKRAGGKYDSADALADMGGFHVVELDQFLPEWREMLAKSRKPRLIAVR